MTEQPEPVEPKKPWWDSIGDDPILNPWQTIAPPCPHCGNPDCWLWHPTGTLRWYCHRCKRRFDPVVAEAKSPKRRPRRSKRSEADDQITKMLVERDIEKFPQLRRLRAVEAEG